jgi:polysaccharide export outer membrane protein
MRPWLVLALGGAMLAASGSAPPVVRAQAAPSTTTAPAPPGVPAAASTDYRVGSGDVLDVTVFGNEDLSRSATVQTNGTISFPLLGDVAVQSLTIDEVNQKLTKLLSDQYLVNPQVEVKVKEYGSQFVSVLGEVNNPGRKPLRGGTRLIDVLVEAGGFGARASGEVIITRRDGFDGGKTSITARLGSGVMSPVDQIALEMPLKNGDLVNVLPKQYVTVEGEVARPGRYVVEGELTVTGAISTAGGLTRFASNTVTIRRKTAAGSATSIVKADLKAIRKGKKTDVLLQADDTVNVSRRLF